MRLCIDFQAAESRLFYSQALQAKRKATMIWQLLFWSGLILSLGIGLVYFRDLGDVSQMLLKVKRQNDINRFDIGEIA